MLEQLVAELADAQQRIEDLTEARDTLQAERDAAWEEIIENPDLLKTLSRDQELYLSVREACDAAYEQGGEGLAKAKVALQDYLVARGLPSAPVASTGDSALDKLVAALL